MTEYETYKLKICTRIIETARLIIKESGRDYNFSCQEWVNGQKIKVSSKGGVADDTK